ncbi:hypothetical protein F2Q68_00025226 [Brassica cretica]|uniref:DNA2/NAM7 helicase helicase domain-containing protein n=1 Tax=Brassica cretica TaxID=69181 RepID=A0A8S9IKK8_BRACR|nr:hypothetical protein F2Q68_00025226 [Brassica cretica]
MFWGYLVEVENQIKLTDIAEEIVQNLDEQVDTFKVRHFDTSEKSELHNLQKLKDEQGGELSSSDEKKYESIKRATEREITQIADVICCTCIGAANPRLSNYRFRQVKINYLTLNISSSLKSNMPALSDRYLLMSLLKQQNLRAYCPRCKAAIRVLNELVCYG